MQIIYHRNTFDNEDMIFLSNHTTISNCIHGRIWEQFLHSSITINNKKQKRGGGLKQWHSYLELWQGNQVFLFCLFVLKSILLLRRGSLTMAQVSCNGKHTMVVMHVHNTRVIAGLDKSVALVSRKMKHLYMFRLLIWSSPGPGR